MDLVNIFQMGRKKETLVTIHIINNQFKLKLISLFTTTDPRA